MRLFALTLLLAAHISCFSQEKSAFIAFERIALPQLLEISEKEFDVRYSYADSIVNPVAISIRAQKYTLRELHDQIQEQSNVSIEKLDARYYSVSPVTIKKQMLEPVLISALMSKGIAKLSDKIAITPKNIEELPGMTDADVLFSLQQLPGVKSPNETASGLHIRGGTPDQNLVLWDGIRMYHPGHLFGMISGFNPNIDQKIELRNKGTHPNFGERISAIVDIQTSDSIASKFSGNAGMNSMNADVFFKAPVISKRFGVHFSARKSFTEVIQMPTFISLSNKVFQNTNFQSFDDQNDFGYHDSSLKLTYRLTDNSTINVSAITIANRLDFSSTDKSSQQRRQLMEITNDGFSSLWKHSYSSRLTHEVNAHYSAYRFAYERRQNLPDADYEKFSKRNRITDSGAGFKLSYLATENITIDLGYQISGNDVSHSFISKTSNIEVPLDQNAAYNVSNSGFANIRLHSRGWDISSGIRATHYSLLEKAFLEPRLALRKNSGKFSFSASYESKTQIMSQAAESVANDLSLENYVWILSDGATHPLLRASQTTAGTMYKSGSWLIDADLYYKSMNGNTAFSFASADGFENQIRNGAGFTKGAEILIQKSAAKWRAWVSYSYQDSQNRYDQINDGKYFASNTNLRHAISASYFREWRRFSASAGMFLHSGKPYSETTEGGQVTSYNSRLLPFYHRLDVSAAYNFTISGKRAKAGISIQNLYNQRSLISKEYERQYAEIGDFLSPNYTLREYRSLGRTPNFFIRFWF